MAFPKTGSGIVPDIEWLNRLMPNGCKLCTYADPSVGGNAGITLTAATVYAMKMPLPGSVLITSWGGNLGTKAGSTLTNSYGGFIRSDGTLIGMTPDQSASATRWDTSGVNGYKEIALTTPVTVTPLSANDWIWWCVYVGISAGTAPKFGASGGVSSASEINWNSTAATSRAATVGVPNTATPFSNITPSSFVQTTQVLFGFAI